MFILKNVFFAFTYLSKENLKRWSAGVVAFVCGGEYLFWFVVEFVLPIAFVWVQSILKYLRVSIHRIFMVWGFWKIQKFFLSMFLSGLFHANH